MKKYLLLIVMLITPILLVHASEKALDVHGLYKNTTSGAFFNGTYAINVTIYNGSTQVYSEQDDVNVRNGTFNYVVGRDVSISEWLFMSDIIWQIKIGSTTFTQQNFTYSPLSFRSLLANNSMFLAGQAGSYYLDNTYNSTDDIVNAIISNLPPTNRTDNDITNLCYNTPSEIYSAAPHTNRTDADITTLAWGQGFYYHQDNVTDIIDSVRPATNLTESDIHGFGFITTVNNGSTLQNSSNITVQGNQIFLNVTCEAITGGAGLCDGVDATGTGAEWTKIQNWSSSETCPANYYMYDTYQNGTYICREDQSGAGDMSALDIVNTTILWNTGFYYSTLNITTIIDANRPGTNRTDADITGLCYNTPAEVYSATPHTNRTDNDIHNVINKTNINISINGLTIDYNGTHWIFG